MKRICVLLVCCGINFANGQQLVIPVVFHILHLGGPENISDAQVLDEMRILNEDYNKLNPDTSNIIPSFKNIAASMNIIFRLANLDPNGNCTNGIEHIYTSATSGAWDNAKIHDWPRDKYLNIWVAKSLQYPTAGYGYYPWIVDTIPSLDGIMLLYDYVGSIGSSTPFDSRAITQFAGQYLGLIPPWGYGVCGQVCGDDSVNDTPITKGWLYCPGAMHAKVCDTSIIENYQNFMEYSLCSCMFTYGQTQRVRTYLNKSIAQRNNLWTTANLIATGTNNANATPCAPVADFHAYSQYICLGEVDTLYDYSYNGAITSRLWTIQNANIISSTDSIVAVTFNATGWQLVTLTATNAQGSNTKAEELVYVYDPAVQLTYPYFYDFEDPTQFNNYWASISADADTPYFQLTDTAGHDDKASVLLNNYYCHTDGAIDELITPEFDLDNIAAPYDTLSFWYTYAIKPYQSPYFDSIQVLATTNCGITYTVLYHNSSSEPSFLDAVASYDYYVPYVGSSLWRRIAIHIPAYLQVSQVHFMIKIFGTSNSNNFYIDDFNIGTLSAAVQPINQLNIGVVPNPFTGNIAVTGLGDAPCQVAVTDIMGREIFNMASKQPVMGRLNLELPATLPPGIYMLKVWDGMSFGTIKLVKE